MPLSCDAPALTERLPLFPGKRQVWVIAVRAATRADAVASLDELFERWHGLFPGPIGAPGAFSQLPRIDGGPERPALAVREPTQLLGVTFDYRGTADSMRWPTLVQRRRERVDPLCPVDPVDAMPIRIQTNAADLPDAQGDETVGPPEGARDDLDLGLPQLPPAGELLDTVKAGFGLALILLFPAAYLWIAKGKR